MNRTEMLSLADTFLGAWNTQEVDKVLACYTGDVEYSDPNTRGSVQGADGLRRYLTKLFAPWQMTWALREGHLFEGGDGCAMLWKATFQRKGNSQVLSVNGMDFVRVRDGRIAVNHVYFDRSLLAPLLV